MTEKTAGGSLLVREDAIVKADIVKADVREATEDSARPRRPRAVTAVAVGHILQGVTLSVAGGILLVGALLSAPGDLTIDRVLRSEWNELFVLGSILLLLGLLALIVTYGLYRVRPWAWSVAMSLQGIGLAMALSNQFLGDLNYNDDVTLAIGILLVFMLNQNEVRRTFQRRETSA